MGIRPAKPAESPARRPASLKRTRVIALLVVAVAAPLGLFWATSAAVGAGDTLLEIESLPVPSDFGGIVGTDAAASGGKFVSFWGNDTLTGSVTTSGPTTTLTLRARGSQCNGAPIGTVQIDGATKLTATVSATSWTNYSAAVSIPAGTHTVTVSYGNDFKNTSCDRNLSTDSLTFVGGSSGGGDTTAPAAPTGLSATAGDANVQLSWAGNTEPDLAGYNVYRGTTTGGPYSKVNANLVTSPSYVDGGRTNGTKYFYVVRAVDTSTNESGNSNEANATPTAAPDTTPPAAPKNLAATAGDTTVSLAWTANTETDLAGYNVFRSTTTGGPYTKINSSLVGGPSYNDTGLTNGTKYFYVVQAIDTSSNPSGNSGEANATPAAAGGGGGGGGGTSVIEAESFTIPADFGGVVSNNATASGGKAVSFWSNDSISKTVTTPAGTGITVRAYGDQCNGAPSLTLAMDGTNVLTVSVSATTWTSYPVTRAVSAGSHTFTVSYTNDSRTSSCDRNLRFDSLTITGTGGGGGGDTTPPSAPISLAASPGNGSASLTWAPNTESDLAGYNVFHSTTSGGPYTKDNSALVTTASYNDTGLTNGTKYFWVVQAVDTSNNSSGNSNETSATPTAGPDTTPPGAPTGLKATGGDTTVALSWASNTEPDLAGYNVLRSTTNGGPYTKINTSLVANPSFNDTGLTNGTTYYYVVQAVDSSSNPSGNSAQAFATPAAAGGGGGGSTLIEAESFTIPSDFGGHVYSDSSASAGQAVAFYSNDSISKTVTTVAGSTITVRAFGDQCNGAPSFTLAMDGTNVFTSAVPAGSWTNYSASKTVGAGSHTFTLSYTNDSKSSTCDRNLRVDSITIGSGSSGTPTQLLPDLVQQPPLQVSVTQSSASYRIGFNSAVENHGQGPLIINGHRPDTSSTMVADQIVNRTDGSTQTFAGIGSMIFYTPHNHWHYVGFDKYELRNPADNSLMAPDQKSGFCLGDRYTPNSNGTRNENPTPGPWTTNNCAPGNTAALNLTEGISVGYGDEYVPQLEGQYIDITGVQPGQYWVVFRTNSNQALKETDYTNDAASVLIQLWPNGYGNLTNGGVTVLKTCPGTATCSLAANAPTPSSFKFSHFGLAIGGLPFQLRHSPPPDDAPLLVPRSARFFAHQALQKVVGQGSAKARLRCTRASRRGFRCAVSWRVAGSTYKGTVEVSLPQHNNQYWWNYRARLVRRGAAGFKQIRTTLRRVQVTHNGRY